MSDAVACSYACLSPSRRAPLFRKASGSIILVACSDVADGLAHVAEAEARDRAFKLAHSALAAPRGRMSWSSNQASAEVSSANQSCLLIRQRLSWRGGDERKTGLIFTPEVEGRFEQIEVPGNA